MRTRVRSPRPRLPGDREPRNIWVEVEEGCLIRYSGRLYRAHERLMVRETEATNYERSRSAKTCR
jgi:hypothetical protein